MTRRAQGWLWSVLAVLALACGNLRSSPHSEPEANDGGETADPPTAGKATTSGGSSPSAGGASGNATGGVRLVLGGSGGTPTTTPNHPEFAGAGGQPDYPADAVLCIYDEDIPANWGAGGAVDVGIGQCAVGVLGSFDFMGCQYELLNETPFDVDPFVGGHSHCCYKSRLIVCR